MNEPSENIILEKNHSRLGIASTVIGITIPILLILFLILGIALGTRKGSIGNYFAMAFLGFGLIAPFLHLVGAVFGIAGLFSKRAKKLFPIIGTVLNIVLGVIGVLIIFLIITNLSFPFH